MANALVLLHAISPLHAGTGQGAEGIDLPIARERSTGLPFLPGSTIKGCLKDHQRQVGNAHVDAVYGPDKQGSSEYAGAVSVGDGRILLFPVRSLAHSFLWVTCPFVLYRFRSDCRNAGVDPPPAFDANLSDEQVALSDSSAATALGSRRCVVLEELDLEVLASAQAQANVIGKWFAQRLFPSGAPANEETAEGRMLVSRFAIVNDANFIFLTRSATEVQAHVAIDHDTGTVIDGALWYQEALPAETVLATLILAGDERGEKPQRLRADKVLGNAIPAAADGREPLLQFGGKAGTGLGWTRLQHVGAANGAAH
jgi:CRISPR-associated protein Cmr4